MKWRYASAVSLDLAQELKRPIFPARADVTEWLGSEQYAYVPYEAAGADRAGGDGEPPQPIVALDPARQLARGAELELRIDRQRSHLFDAASGAALR